MVSTRATTAGVRSRTLSLNTLPHGPESARPRSRNPSLESQSGDLQEKDSKHEDMAAYSEDLKVLGLILLVALVSLFMTLFFFVFGPMDQEARSRIHFPTSVQAVQVLHQELMSYATEYQGRLLFGHCCCYLFLQTFAIPGTVFFNLLGGALFGLEAGFTLCLCYNTLGSVFMYLLSKWFGQRLVLHHFPEKLQEFRGMLRQHHNDLTMHLIFIRIFPFSPNWFINIASPHLHIPVWQFALSVGIGLVPYNFLSCKAGVMLSELQSKSDIIDTRTTIFLVLVAIVGFVVLPRLKKRFVGSPPEHASQD